MRRFFYGTLASFSLLGNSYALPTQDFVESGQEKAFNSSSQEPSTFSFFGDYLYWFVSEEPTFIFANVQFDQTSGTQTTKVFQQKMAQFPWQSGFRLGVGYNSDYDFWDFKLYWSRYSSKSTNFIPSGSGLIYPEFFGTFVSLDFAYQAKINFWLNYNVIDLELGRSFDFDEIFYLKPFIGIKGGSIKQSISSYWDNLLILPDQSHETISNNFYGLGISGGSEAIYNMMRRGKHHLNLNGRFSIAGLYGKWNCNDLYYDSLGKVYPVIFNHSYQGELFLQGLIALSWVVHAPQEKFLFSTSLGYEMQWWLNQLRIATYQETRMHGDLTIQGLTLDFKFNF
jgi:hypothetical protein